MKYAEVAVDAPVGHSRTFSYGIPDRLLVEPGQLVWVPFGRRVAQGVVVELTSVPKVEATRDILHTVETSPLISPTSLELAHWLSRYYRSSLFDPIALFLPPGFKAQVRSRIITVPTEEAGLATIKPETRTALQQLGASSPMSQAEFIKLLGRGGERELSRLIEKGLVQRELDLPRPRITPRYECYLLPVGGEPPMAPHCQGGDAGGLGPDLPDKLGPQQLKLLNAVCSDEGPYPMSLGSKEFGWGVAEALVEKGLVALEWVRVETCPVSGRQGVEAGVHRRLDESTLPLTLTPEQTAALAQITDALEHSEVQPRSFLLHGVTGSGKTEVYLQAIQRVVDQGQQAIFLVPEIALTSQTLQRVNARFPGCVAVIHSHLTPREKFDQWWNIRDGNYDVVVGPRSALFAPVPHLGLIIVDEEHEWTYKQQDSQPLYHARTVALKLSQLTAAVVVLGSATPDVETYYHAQRGRHRLLELPYRIREAEIPPTTLSRRGARGDLKGELDGHRAQELASVEICDMRQELREGNRSIFSRQLAQALKDCVAQGQQAILFLNRRGSASIIQCRDCGCVATCRSCSISLTYHSTDARLVCHRCNRRTRVPQSCPQCGGNRIRQLGAGTQRVVEEVVGSLPGVRVERWDSDTTRSGANHDDTMRRLADGEIDVLVGTQMVAKGLHVPNVTLVGVVLADIGLHLPDFRAGERAFNLLCQVAGRAGRGLVAGHVIVQTYQPQHYAIVAAAAQDYAALYQLEIESRRQQGNPPFNQLVHLVCQNTSNTLCQRQAIATARLLRQKAYAQGLTDLEVIGPAPGIPQRLKGRYRWHLIVRGRKLHEFLDTVDFGQGWTGDVDPANVL